MRPMRSELLEAARAISPEMVRDYLLSRGFDLRAKTDFFDVYSLTFESVDVPTRPALADYPKRLVEALHITAVIEGTTFSALVKALNKPPQGSKGDE